MRAQPKSGARVAFINYKTRDLNAKVVYVGPPGSGKSTNLRCIGERTAKQHVGDLISLNRDAERTAYFDFLPLFLGRIHGFRSRLHLYTLPGHIPFDSSKRMILSGIDAMVFVADSGPDRVQDNLDSWKQIRATLADYGLDWKAIPRAVQFNKRDVAGALAEDELRRLLDVEGAGVFGCVAVTGQGVFDTLKYVSREILRRMLQSGRA